MSENTKQNLGTASDGETKNNHADKSRQQKRRPSRHHNKNNRSAEASDKRKSTADNGASEASPDAGMTAEHTTQRSDRRDRRDRRNRRNRGAKKEAPDTAATQEEVSSVLEDTASPSSSTAPTAIVSEEELNSDPIRAEEISQSAEIPKAPVEIIGVRFKAAGKVYYFDPDGKQFQEDDEVIVETARRLEFGFVVNGNRTVMASDIVAPLKKVIRPANEEDHRHYEENNRKRDEAFRICKEKIEEHGIDMKLIDVEYTFDNNKLLFYFTADGRVDFRELVKDLASIFRTRIELRQIGIRDEAKLMGGLGVCGRPFCCHSFLSDFVQVSIKMAKEQNLSLNSAKISGTCGRLMCCLRYEYDVYEEEIRKTPRMDAVVNTPDGEGVVCEVIPLAGLVRVRFIGARGDMPPKLYHRDDVEVRGKMNWKSGNITYITSESTPTENEN